MTTAPRTAHPAPRTSLLSARAQAVSASATMALDARAKALKAAAKRALAADATHYTTVNGDPALRQKIAERTAELTGVPFSVGQVIATSGAKEALYLAFQALCDPGDEVLIPAPFWVTYSEQ